MCPYLLTGEAPGPRMGRMPKPLCCTGETPVLHFPNSRTPLELGYNILVGGQR